MRPLRLHRDWLEKRLRAAEQRRRGPRAPAGPKGTGHLKGAFRSVRRGLMQLLKTVRALRQVPTRHRRGLSWAAGPAACLRRVRQHASYSSGAKKFIFNPYGHGWHIDRRRFDERLANAAQDDGVRVVPGARVTHVRRRDRRVGVLISSVPVRVVTFKATLAGWNVGANTNYTSARLDKIIWATADFPLTALQPSGAQTTSYTSLSHHRCLCRRRP